MKLGKYFDIKRPETKFSIAWGILGFFLGSLVVEFFTTLEKIIDLLIRGLFWLFLLPAKIITILPTDNKIIHFAAAMIVALIVGPIAYKVYKFIRKSPL